MHEEYQAIVDAGFLLQIDDPRFSTYYIANPDKSMEQCRAWAAGRVQVLNHALRCIPLSAISLRALGMSIPAARRDLMVGRIAPRPRLVAKFGKAGLEAFNAPLNAGWDVCCERTRFEGRHRGTILGVLCCI